jgi:hypothetical protein
MKIAPINGPAAVSQVVNKAEPAKQTFKEVMSQVDTNTLNSLQRDLNNFSQGIMSGKTYSSKDLIVYQIKAGQFGLGVELVSKLAESVSSTVKKLEQGH